MNNGGINLSDVVFQYLDDKQSLLCVVISSLLEVLIQTMTMNIQQVLVERKRHGKIS